jgi:hypothetical protein
MSNKTSAIVINRKHNVTKSTNIPATILATPGFANIVDTRMIPLLFFFIIKNKN